MRQGRAQGFGIDAESHGILAVNVVNAGHFAFAANAPGGLLTGLIANFDVQDTHNPAFNKVVVRISVL
jgi:hypothetical protein